ncbi:hypothetical protein M7I_0049 [Glarea lozoyensis 74030]|uniref:Uncharacterized protein n=1 Tax=Glarea lozoyensis (strain ATCC 74030 / MF5533) TaxID=1104152 RepID=H0ECB5_GLAL7|nr:hypothetical protein M7I_0049 [Glarea lozoyensis 74030]
MENEEIDETMATLMDAVNLICTVEDEYVHQDIHPSSVDGSAAPNVKTSTFVHNVALTDLATNTIQITCSIRSSTVGCSFHQQTKFDQATTSMSFYLHYPWFFGPPIFEKLVVGTPNEEESRALLVQLEESLDGIHLQVALDGVIRLLAPEDWNWRQVQDHVKPLLELQLSAPNINSSEVLRLRKLLFDTDLDRNSVQGCKDALKVFIASRSSGDGFADLSIPADKISESAKYMEMLSRGFDTWQEYTIAYSSILARVVRPYIAQLML